MPPSSRRNSFVLLVLCCLLACAFAPSAMAATPSAAHLGDRALRAGASGADVKELQKALSSAGFQVAVDGAFGPSTVQAVKRFQRAARLQTSGTVGPKTVRALKQALRGTTANVNGGFDPERANERRKSLGDRIPLRRGMSGQDVRVLQDYLRKAGVRVAIDGEFGTGTLRAVRRFELRSKRPINGVMDAGDIDTLRTMAGEEDPGLLTAPVALPAGQQAVVGPDGLAAAPAEAPDAVKAIIAAGNEIAKKPYVYGGGHARFPVDTGYDCSGSVSYALHGAGLLDAPLPSSGFFGWGEAGAGQWVTIYTKASHMYMVVAGVRFDTSGRSAAGTRWQAEMRSAAGYQVRHPPGL